MAKKKKVAKKVKQSHRIYFLLGAFLVLILVLGFLLISKFQVKNEPLLSFQIAQLVGSSTIQIPGFDTSVKLENGSGVPDSEGSGYVNVTEPYFSVRTPSGANVFAVMNYNLGGSGVFASIVMFDVAGDKATFTSSYPIGDRVHVTNISGPDTSETGEYEIIVDYLDRAATQSMADTPTVPKSVSITVTDNKILP